MPDSKLPVPEGIGHDPDLSNLSAAELDKHHRKGLQTAIFLHGVEGGKAYKAKYPDAAKHRSSVNVLAYTPKPAGYVDCLASMVEQWFASDTALGMTSRADVERLNDKLGSAFNPDNHFSKPLSTGVLKRLRTVFEQHDASLDTDRANTMSKVRRAVRAAKASTGPASQPFGNVGARCKDVLTIGTQNFRIEPYRGRDCIRVTAEGVTQRFYLANVLALLAGLKPGGGWGNPTHSLFQRKIGELVSAPETIPKQGSPQDPETSSPGDLDKPNRQALTENPSLAERIGRLTSQRLAAEQAVSDQLARSRAAGKDPLEF